MKHIKTSGARFKQLAPFLRLRSSPGNLTKRIILHLTRQIDADVMSTLERVTLVKKKRLTHWKVILPPAVRSGYKLS